MSRLNCDIMHIQHVEKPTLKQQEEHEREIIIHSDPMLPDDIDEFGHLPALRCGWTKCGKEFATKHELLNHVRSVLPHPFIPRFHVNCMEILECNPNLTLDEFSKKIKDCYSGTKQKQIERDELISYYNKFQPLFKKHLLIKDVIHYPQFNKELTQILFNFRIIGQKKLLKKNHEKRMYHVHRLTILPDDIDENGKLPDLKCGYKQCGMKFKNKDDLIQHIKKYVPHVFIPRFHVNVRNILETEPDLTLDEFIKRVKDCYDIKIGQFIDNKGLVDYYKKYKSIFKKHQYLKDTVHQSTVNKEIAEILFNFRIQSQKKLSKQNNIPQQFL